MIRAYPHLKLTRWPFPVVPDPDYCTFLAARSLLRDDVHDLLNALARRDTSSIHLFWAWFGAGNADPVPVSGLEVTSYMKQKDVDGRLVNPFDLFRRAVARALDDVQAFQGRVVSTRVYRPVVVTQRD